MIQLVGFAILVVMFASWMDPVQVIKDWIGIREVRFGWIVSCSKCLGFWSGLIYFQDPFKAAIVSLLAYLITYVIDRTESWYTGD